MLLVVPILELDSHELLIKAAQPGDDSFAPHLVSVAL